jgi:hypothetical protein
MILLLLMKLRVKICIQTRSFAGIFESIEE